MSLRLFFACAALLALLLAAAPARACCIYNDTAFPLSVLSDLQDIYNWLLKPGDYRCTQGTGDKNVDLRVMNSDGSKSISSKGTLWVDPEGWIRVGARQHDKWKAVSYDGQGKREATVYLLPTRD